MGDFVNNNIIRLLLALIVALATTFAAANAASASPMDAINEALTGVADQTPQETLADLREVSGMTTECAGYWALAYITVGALDSVMNDGLDGTQMAAVGVFAQVLMEQMGPEAAVDCALSEM